MSQEEFLNDLLNPDKNQDSFSLKSLTKDSCEDLLTQYALIERQKQK